MRARWLTLAAGLLTACGDSAENRARDTELALVEVSRIGTVEGEGSSLSAVSGVVVSDSTVLVLERDPARVAVFGYEGKWLRDLGGVGDGPGEFRMPSLIGMQGDDVWVGDPFGGRMEVLTSTGRPIQSFRWDVAPDSLGTRAFPTAPLQDGSVLAGPGPLNLGAASSGSVTHQTYYRVSRSGQVLSELLRVELSGRDFIHGALSSGGGFVGMHPLGESPIVAAYPDGSGLVVVERPAARDPGQATFRIRLLPLDGKTRDLAVPYVPIPTEGWLERRLADTEQRMIQTSGAVNRGMLEALGEAWKDRPFYPPVTAVVAGRDGSIWLRREETGSDSVAWEVFGRTTELYGQLKAPADLRILAASLQEVWAVQTNELDVPFVVRLKVVEHHGSGH